MGMTITEKIMAAHCGRETVSPGDFIMADLDMILANDVTSPIAIKLFEKAGAKTVFDKNKVALVPSHFTPNKDIKTAEQCKILRNFAHEHNIKHYYDTGQVGVEHVLLVEKGAAWPGYMIMGADSHTCTFGALGAFATGVGSTDYAAAMITGKAWFRVPESMKFIFTGTLNPWVGGKDLILHTIGDIGVDGALYRAMEFCGDTIENLDMESRFTLPNMAIEAGGKSGIIKADEKTLAYLEMRTGMKAPADYKIYESDSDAHYVFEKRYNVENLEPLVAFPNLPENTRPISEVGEIKIDQVVIGSCTNGRISDFRQAAEILKGQKIASHVRLMIIPTTPLIFREAMEEGLFSIFLEAGATISPPTCGPCLGGHMGILGSKERAVTTTNRNFVGRMGHPESEVYLANPYVAAASAVKGYITGPEEIVGNSRAAG